MRNVSVSKMFTIPLSPGIFVTVFVTVSVFVFVFLTAFRMYQRCVRGKEQIDSFRYLHAEGFANERLKLSRVIKFLNLEANDTIQTCIPRVATHVRY